MLGTVARTELAEEPSVSCSVISTLVGVAIAVFFLIRVMPRDVVTVKLRAKARRPQRELRKACCTTSDISPAKTSSRLPAALTGRR